MYIVLCYYKFKKQGFFFFFFYIVKIPKGVNNLTYGATTYWQIKNKKWLILHDMGNIYIPLNP